MIVVANALRQETKYVHQTEPSFANSLTMALIVLLDVCRTLIKPATRMVIYIVNRITMARIVLCFVLHTTIWFVTIMGNMFVNGITVLKTAADHAYLRGISSAKIRPKSARTIIMASIVKYNAFQILISYVMKVVLCIANLHSMGRTALRIVFPQVI